jgi:hypothetical protein
LNRIKEDVYGKEESVIERSIRDSNMEEMKRKEYRSKMLIDKEKKIMCRYKDMRDEVKWRMFNIK